MYPTLSEGDEVLVDLRAYDRSRPRPGDVVVAVHPDRPQQRLIKRVSTLEAQGCRLVGDNADPDATTDSRSFGLVPYAKILGKVRARFAAR